MARLALASRPRRTGAPRMAPAAVPGTATHRVLPPRKRPNTYWRSRRPRRTPAEVDTLIGTAKRLGRHGHRDATMIQLAYRHGLRVAELLSRLSWDQVDLRDGLSSLSVVASTVCRACIPYMGSNSARSATWRGSILTRPMSL